jgi:hypothetical protein
MTAYTEASIALTNAHVDEAASRQAEFYNLGWASGADFIHSKTDRGTLYTQRTADGFVHEWGD